MPQQGKNDGAATMPQQDKRRSVVSDPRAGDVADKLSASEMDLIAAAAGIVFALTTRWFFDVATANGARQHLLEEATALTGGSESTYWRKRDASPLVEDTPLSG